MRLIFWVTALAVLTIATAKNSTTKAKPKRQLDSIRSPHDFQYSLVLPHSRVQHFRALSSGRRISNVIPKGGKLPPYAVQMEPVVQYSQKDPLYDPSLDNLDDTTVNKNEISQNAQAKILNVQDQSPDGSQVLDNSFGPPYGSLPTAPLYSQESQPHYSHDPHHHYYEAPEPIIEIIIKESNETLPAPPPAPIHKKKKEPVQVFYVKYSKDPYAKDKVIYEKPIPAITPPSNHEEDHHDEYVTVTPEPYYLPQQTTTLRAIIKPESEVYHSDSSVKVTFGSENHHGEHLEQLEGHEETAPRPAIAYPQQHPPLERSHSQNVKQYHESPRSGPNSNTQNYRHGHHQAQNRIQFQQPYISGEPQLPRQGPSVVPFRQQPQAPRQNSFGPPPTHNSPPAFSNGPGNSVPHFTNNRPTIPGPIGPVFSTGFPRPSNGPTFQPRPSGPQFGPRPQFNGPPRNAFHSGPQRTFHPPQAQPFFDEPKYLQENYHTITTDQVDPPKEQLLPSRPPQTFNNIPKPSPSPTPSFQDHRPQFNQQLPQQRPFQNFDSIHNKPTQVTPSRSPFFNLKPSPPQIENNQISFQPNPNHQQQNQFSFHNGPQAPQRPPQNSFAGPVAPAPSPIATNQFLPQPSSPSLYNFRPQPSPTPVHQQFQQNPSARPEFNNRQTERPILHSFNGPSERPQHQNSPSERPQFQISQSQPERPAGALSSFHDQANIQHQQNVGQFVPNTGELIASIPKYEQHITVSGPTAQPQYSGFTETNQITPTASNINLQYQQQLQQHQHQQQNQRQHIHQQQQQQQNQRQQQQNEQNQRQQQQLHQQHLRQQQQQQEQLQLQQQHEQSQQQVQHQQHHQHQQHQQQQSQQPQQQSQQPQQQSQQQQDNVYDAEQEQLRLQLAENVKKQQEEIQRLQTQLLYAQHQTQLYDERSNYNSQQQTATSSKPRYSNERSNGQHAYVTSTEPPRYYQSTSRTVEIKPTTQKYLSSTLNSISTTPEARKEEKKKRPAIELPDEVPDDLRQQLLSSGILENADISVLDYDKVGDTPLDSLPPDQLANFFSAGGAQQIASTELKPIVVKPNGERIESRIDDEEDDDQEIAASENVPTYVAPPPSKQAVEMKVVHFNPKTAEGQNIAKEYVKKDATQVDPVALNDKKYNRYLPLKVSGNQFPLPDILKGRKITSVVVLAPVETEELNSHSRSERAAESLKGIKFIAGESLQDLLKKPTKENFVRWLDTEKQTAVDLQSVVLLVTGNDDPSDDREIYMYDISSGNVNKLSGDLSSAFVDAAENNSLTRDLEKLAIEGEGTPENFERDNIADGSENVPFLVDLSGVSLDENNNQVSIESGYSKTKQGRALRRT